MSYQRIVVSTGANVGAPGPLPDELMGLADATLANLPAELPEATLAQLGYSDAGFLPVADPPPPPLRTLARIDFIRRFTAAEMGAIQGSADPLVKNFLFMLTVVDAVELDNPDTQNGVGYLAQAGLITADRPAVILA